MSSEIEEQFYCPQVAEEKKPKLSQVFSSIEDAFNFYNEYARECGFSAKMCNNKRRNGTNELYWKQFSCFKEGFKRGYYEKHMKHNVERSGERNQGNTRVGCKAKMCVIKLQTGSNWLVKTFVEEHNHTLSSPSKVHLLRSHRRMSNAKRCLTQQLSEANIPTSQQVRVMEIESDGPQYVGCTEKDVWKFKQKVRDEEKDLDAELLVEFFASEQEKNPTFYYSYEVDEHNRFVRCFWVNAFARRSYQFFGDVVVFDTTYNTNKYDMIFAPLVGINHHGQTIISACALLSGEKIESFVWLFEHLLKAMPKGAPQVIITDQDLAMTKAITQVLPNTFHHYCMWHILNKFSTYVDSVVYRDNYNAFKNIIFGSDTPEEFESKWTQLIQQTQLENNHWLSQLYEIRTKWVPAFFNDVFMAGVLSSQRVESSHAFFKRYISNRNSLMDFIVRFNRAINHQRHDELVAEHVDLIEQPKLISVCPMETQMVKLYTKRNFLIFQTELFESGAYYLSTVFENDEVHMYVLQQATKETSSSNSTKLKHNKFDDFVSCSCKMFTFKGIPCRHMLAWFRVNQVMFLPPRYILKRWTKKAKLGDMGDTNCDQITDDHGSSLVSRHASLSKASSTLIDYGSLNVECTNFFLNEFGLLRAKVIDMIGDKIIVPKSISKKSTYGARSINNPVHVRSKGCGKRIKSAKEVSISKHSRLFRGCGLCGQQHDKRNCPKLQGDHQERSINDEDTCSSQSDDDDLASQAGSNLNRQHK